MKQIIYFFLPKSFSFPVCRLERNQKANSWKKNLKLLFTKSRNDLKQPETTYNEQETTWNGLKRPTASKNRPETTYGEQETTWNDLQRARNNLKRPTTSKTQPTITSTYLQRAKKDVERQTTSRFSDYFTIWGKRFSSLTRFPPNIWFQSLELCFTENHGDSRA